MEARPDIVESAVRKRRRYSAEEKLHILGVVRSTSFATAHERYGVSRTSVHEWRRGEEQLLQLTRTTRRSGNVQTRTPSDSISSEVAIASGERITTEQVPTSIRTVHSISPSTSTNPTSPNDSAMTAPANDCTRRLPESLHRQQHPEYQPGETQLPDKVAIEDKRHDECIQPAAASNVECVADLTAEQSAIVGFHGACDGFAEIAARRLFKAVRRSTVSAGSSYEHVGYAQAVHLLEALNQRYIDYAIVATKTLFSSTFRAALDRVISSRFSVVAEVTSDETVCICGLPGAELSTADCVMSDWNVLARFEEYVLRMEVDNKKTINRQVAWDSATACRTVLAEQDRKTLVLCSQEAAHATGLVVLQARLLTGDNCTKYTVLGRLGSAALAANPLPSSGATPSFRQGTVLIDSPGRASLSDILNAFKYVGINIEYFSCHALGDDPTRSGERCIVSYRASNAVAEATLTKHLNAAGRVAHLGHYWTFYVQDDD